MHIGINAHLLAFTGNYRQAGLSRYIYELVDLMPRLQPTTTFTALTGRAPIPDSFSAAPNLHFAHSRFPTARAPIRILWEQTVLPVASARQGLDLLFCPVNVRPIFSTCPTVVTVHDVGFLRYPQAFHPLKRLYLTIMTRWSVRHASHVIAVSEATRQDVIGFFGANPRRVTTVHNGVGTQFTPASPDEKAAFRRDKGITGRVVLYIGTLEPRKNLTTLIEAFSRIAAQPEFADVTLLIGGSKGWYYDEIFASAERLGLTSQGRVRWLGRVPDDELALWYNIANVCAYPSLYEGFGLPPLEAMACGTPVITSNTSALPEVVGTAGILLEPTDVQAWATALDKVLTDSVQASTLSRAGLQQASQFSWERTAEETAAVLEAVVAHSSNKKKR
ncbi:MAG TPA: glycosyltransferase family 1 protein [Chloroflexia bacterium]|nr:glycosyltransferase family 1 protein [Chloroflexia bacterium]